MAKAKRPKPPKMPPRPVLDDLAPDVRRYILGLENGRDASELMSQLQLGGWFRDAADLLPPTALRSQEFGERAGFLLEVTLTTGPLPDGDGAVRRYLVDRARFGLVGSDGSLFHWLDGARLWAGVGERAAEPEDAPSVLGAAIPYIRLEAHDAEGHLLVFWGTDLWVPEDSALRVAIARAGGVRRALEGGTVHCQVVRPRGLLVLGRFTIHLRTRPPWGVGVPDDDDDHA
jgi:hypothetical protein